MQFTRCLRLLLTLSITGTLAAVPPSLDPFYTPPAGFASTSPGTVLRNRTIAAAYFGLVPDPVEAYQLLYRTNAINGSAIATVTTVFVPSAPQTDRFVSFHTAYDSSASICDPSYNYQLLSLPTDIIDSLEMLLIEGYLLQGYIVSSPDYEGPDTAFGAGRLAGTGVLDSMRAVSNFHSTLGLNTSTPDIVGVGYSGGAIATGWAASLQASYAPELPVRGWSMGGTPSNLTGTAVYIDGTLFAGFLPAAINGLKSPSAYYTQLNPLVNEIATQYGKDILSIAAGVCAPEDLVVFGGQSIASPKFQTLGDRFLYEPTIAWVLEQQIMGLFANDTPVAPVYMYHASQDEIIPYLNASTTRAAWCADGASVDFVTYGNGGHVTTEVLGYPDVVNFVNAAFAGTLETGCTTSTTLNNTLDPEAFLAELEPVLVQLLSVLDVLGEADENIVGSLATLNTTVPI